MRRIWLIVVQPPPAVIHPLTLVVEKWRILPTIVPYVRGSQAPTSEIIFIHQGAGVSFASIREEPGLFEVLDRILDSGIVIEISERTAPEGIELIHSQSRITVASQETYRKKL